MEYKNQSLYMKKLVIAACSLLIVLAATAQTGNKTAAKPKTPAASATQKGKARMVEITTEYGKMIVKLSDSTPLHRDNFIKLVKQGFYDSLMFHRIIQGFM